MSVLGTKRKFSEDKDKVAPIADFKPFPLGVRLQIIASERGQWLVKQPMHRYWLNQYDDHCATQFWLVFQQWFCGPNTRIVLLNDGHRRTEYPFKKTEHYEDVKKMIRYWGIDATMYSVNETVMFLAIYSQLQIFWKSAVFCKTNTNYYDQRHCLDQLVIDIRQLDDAIRNSQDDKKLEPLNKRWWRDLIVHFRDIANRRCAFNVAKILKVRA